MEDIAPALYEKIKNRFAENLKANSKISKLLKQISDKKADYQNAEEYAYEIGNELAKAFREILSSKVLPDGRMYFNIAERVVRPMLEQDFGLVSDATKEIQTALNKAANIGLKAQTVQINEDRLKGIIDQISNAQKYDDVAAMLDEPVKNFSMNVVDETLKANVRFQGRAGLMPRVIRKAESKACKWCRSLAGEYIYPDVPDDVYRRHENCMCVVEYFPGDGKRQDVWSKKWR